MRIQTKRASRASRRRGRYGGDDKDAGADHRAGDEHGGVEKPQFPLQSPPARSCGIRSCRFVECVESRGRLTNSATLGKCYLLSTINVTGPSLTNSTFMSAPNRRSPPEPRALSRR